MSYADAIYDTLFREINGKKKVIFSTSNSTLDKLEKIHGAHITSLLTSTMLPVEVNNSDYRKLIGEEIKKEFENS